MSAAGRPPRLAPSAALTCALALATAAAPGPLAEGGGETVATIRSPYGPADFRIADFTGDGSEELLLVGDDGRAVLYDADPERELAAVEASRLVLDDPVRTLLALAPMLPTSAGLDLLVLGPRGLRAQAFAPDGSSRPAVNLARTARFRMRSGRPTFTSFAQDVNRDGRVDLVVPTGDACELWLQDAPRPGDAGPDGGPPEVELRREATISVELERWGNRNPEALSYMLESAFSVPGLQTRDVNGDGRPDLTVTEGQRRAFHLQSEDGSFPVEPDVTLDLDIFRDTDFDGGIKPGQPLVVDAGANYEIRDLDDDGIEDYVIAHGRKVWVFLGNSSGPQFSEPASILRSAEDVTALTVLELDGDGRPDLLLVKVQVPTVASLIRGLVSEWDIRITAAGYGNTGKGSFETRAGWKSELTVRLPSIVRILKDPAEIVRRFEDVESRFRISEWADVDGDGVRDLVLVSEDHARLEVWRGRGDGRGEIDTERILRELLFEDSEQVYDLDRAVMWLGSLADRRIAALTEGRKPDHVIELRDRDEARLVALDVGDFDGDGRDLLVVGYRGAADGSLVLDLIRP